jgi:hypothetical protein
MSNTKQFYIAYTNTDCTEGRGHDVPIAVCELEATAKRIAKKQYVQGSDGPVRGVNSVNIDGKWYIPTEAINIIKPSKADIAEQARVEAKQCALEKAKALGLSEEEINALISRDTV